MIQTKNSIQECYDLVADEYARRMYDELNGKPSDRLLLDRFAENVRNLGVACDLGCGPGQVARYLRDKKISVCGMDLSQGMVEKARQLNPGLEFSQGDMRALPVRDGSWAGIVAFYAVVNLAPSEVARSLREMMRALVAGGWLLLSFHIGEDSSQVEDLWGSGAVLEFQLFRVNTVVNLIRSAGFEIEEIIERGPYAPEVEYQSRRAYIFAQKPMIKTIPA